MPLPSLYVSYLWTNSLPPSHMISYCTKQMTRFIVLGCFLLAVSNPHGLWAADTEDKEVNHCHDPQAWVRWNQTVAKNPDDMELQFLHALWLGLCLKVERQELSVEQATGLFEQALSQLVERRQAERDKDTEAPV